MGKRAFYIIGPESSGTRMLTDAFIHAGVFGESDHFQEMDYMNLEGFPDDIVYRNSVPHAGHLTPIAAITSKIESFGYKVIHVVIDREDKYILLSKVKRGHRPDIETARAWLAIEREHIATQMTKMGVQPVLVQYEIFVSDAAERRKLFTSYMLPEPVMCFFNANDTYKQKGLE